MNINTNIRHLRQQKQITQEQLAVSLGISCQAVSKWETGANTPDIALLPAIARFFGITIDALFSDQPPAADHPFDPTVIRDDGVLRIIQLHGQTILNIHTPPTPDQPPIELTFPRNCNQSTQYFKVEIYGNLLTDAAINGDVVCHGNLSCGEINGDVRCDGDLRVKFLNPNP